MRVGGGGSGDIGEDDEGSEGGESGDWYTYDFVQDYFGFGFDETLTENQEQQRATF